MKTAFFTNKLKYILTIFILVVSLWSCQKEKEMEIKVYETSEAGNSLKVITEFSKQDSVITIDLNPEEKFQTITGFGGSFTEASATLLNRLSPENRKKVLNAYFSEDGANYSLTRTHIASCDFSLSNYTYAKVENDMTLEHFTIEDDKDDLIPMILEAKKYLKTDLKSFLPLGLVHRG